MATSQTIFIHPSASPYKIPSSSIPPTTDITNFHSILPSYIPTPLIPLTTLAQTLKLNLTNLHLKDERKRFSLPSFKPLGIAWAIRNALIAELSESLPSPLPSTISLPDLVSKVSAAQITLITATDGKLGRIIAKLGKFFGVASINTRIFVSEDLDESVKARIKAEGAEVIVAQGDFEVAVREAWLHSVATDGVLVLIDAEENYEDIPRWIVEGYSTIFHELDTQLPTSPDLIILPVGVGGLAQAGLTHYKSPTSKHITRFLTVEPEVAACLLSSLQANKRTTIEPQETILNHLNYPSVSETSWEILRDGVDASTVVSDSQVLEGMKELRSVGIEVGSCGGAVLAALKNFVAVGRMGELGLNEDATVVLICTDGKDD